MYKFIIDGKQYELADAVADKEALSERISDEMNPIYEDLVDFIILEANDKEIAFRYERTLKSLPIKGFLYQADASLITGFDPDFFDPILNPKIPVRSVPFDNYGRQLFVFEIEELFKREIEIIGKSDVKKVKIIPGINTLDIIITYK